MAAETAPTPAAAAVPAAAAAPRGGLRSRKFKILALLLVVLTVEAAGVYMLLPAPGGAATGAEEPKEAEAEPHADEHHHGAPSEMVEVPIDPPFNITNSRAVPGSIIHVSFHLVAVVAGSQETAFTDAVNVAHNARVRQAIVMVMRSCSMADLGDPELGMLKRRIREEINKVLRKSYVSEVVISDFKTLEH